MSMRPGVRNRFRASITAAPGWTGVRPLGPTVTTRSPSITTVTGSPGVRPVPSIRVPPTIAIMGSVIFRIGNFFSILNHGFGVLPTVLSTAVHNPEGRDQVRTPHLSEPRRPYQPPEGPTGNRPAYRARSGAGESRTRSPDQALR